MLEVDPVGRELACAMARLAEDCDTSGLICDEALVSLEENGVIVAAEVDCNGIFVDDSAWEAGLVLVSEGSAVPVGYTLVVERGRNGIVFKELNELMVLLTTP